MSLAYYRKEQERHPWLNLTRCAFEDAERAFRLLCREYEVRLDGVERTSGNRSNYWSPRRRVVVFNTDHLNWLTVVHEFVHAWDEKTRPQSARWHDAEHAELVDILARKLVASGWIESLPAERAARDRARQEERAARAAYQNDPAVIRAAKVEKRRAQIAGLLVKIRGCMIREKALTTRLKRARRSLAVLERTRP